MLTITQRPIDKLIPYARNSRTHSDAQISQIAGSIKEFGFVNPVLVGADGVIIAGHGRVLAAHKLGMAEVPTIVLDHLSDNQRKALILADNRIALNAAWDEEMLALELEALREEEFDIAMLGFSDLDLANLFADADAESEDHWQGMPEYENEDKRPFRSLAVHFKDQAMVERFCKLLSMSLSPGAKYMWFPQIEIISYSDKRYTAAGDA